MSRVLYLACYLLSITCLYLRCITCIAYRVYTFSLTIHTPDALSNICPYYILAFTFFADPAMQSFYKRFIRDLVRYRDVIQCAGHELVAAVREDALKTDPAGKGAYYALHVRRGDFQFKVCNQIYILYTIVHCIEYALIATFIMSVCM